MHRTRGGVQAPKCGKGLDGQGLQHLTYRLRSSLRLPASELDGREARCDVVREEVIALQRERNDGDWTRELAVAMGPSKAIVQEKHRTLPVTDLLHLNNTGIHGAL